MYGGREASGVTDFQEVVGAVRLVLGGYLDGRLGGGMGGGVGGDGRDSDEDGRLIRWDDNVSNVIFGTAPNYPLAYAPVLELQHTNMSMIGGNGC